MAFLRQAGDLVPDSLLQNQSKGACWEQRDFWEAVLHEGAEVVLQMASDLSAMPFGTSLS